MPNIKAFKSLKGNALKLSLQERRKNFHLLFYTILCSFNFLTKSIIQFSSVAQLCPTLCDPINLSMPGLPVHHQLPESTQTHVH